MTKSVDFNQELKEMLPAYYHDIMEFNEIIKAESSALAVIDDWSKSGLNQTFIETATWGLGRLESIFGIKPDSLKPIEHRRSILKAKIIGSGIVTVNMLKEVAESWFNGKINVIESTQGISIKFISLYGVPSNLEDVEAMLREIVPAHLILNFEFTYTTWGEYNKKNQSWSDVNVANLTWSEFERA